MKLFLRLMGKEIESHRSTTRRRKTFASTDGKKDGILFPRPGIKVIGKLVSGSMIRRRMLNP
jgi:hypothetical protein